MRYAGTNAAAARGDPLSWLNPTRPGDTFSAVSEIVEITPSRSRPHRGSVRVRRETCNQHGDIVQTFAARLIVPRLVASQSDISGAELALSKSAKS
jgi:acyl dehydratase